jgi:hypothetical protein
MYLCVKCECIVSKGKRKGRLHCHCLEPYVVRLGPMTPSKMQALREAKDAVRVQEQRQIMQQASQKRAVPTPDKVPQSHLWYRKLW